MFGSCYLENVQATSFTSEIRGKERCLASFYKTVEWHLLLFSLNNIQSFPTVVILSENLNILYIDIIILVFL